MLTQREKWAIARAVILLGIAVLIMINSISIDFGREKEYEMSYGDRLGTYSGDVNEEGIPDGIGNLYLKNEDGVGYNYRGKFVNGHFEGEGRIEWYYRGERIYETGMYRNDEIVPVKLKEAKNHMLWNTDMYTYYCIEFTGVVEDEPEYTEEFTGFNVIWDIENKDDALIVNVYDPDFEVETGDYVRVMGVVESYYTKENKDGEEKTVPIVVAYEYDVITYEEALSPELFEKDPEKEYLRPVWYMK